MKKLEFLGVMNLGITKKNIKCLSSFMISMLIVGQASAATIFARNVENVVLDSKASSSYESFIENKYSQFLRNTTLNVYSGQTVVHNASTVISGNGEIVSDIFGGNGEVVRVNIDEEATFTITAPEEKLYYIKFNYLADSDSILPVEASIKINGEYTYYELRRLLFENRWSSPEKILLDKYGNEIVPRAQKMKTWENKFVMDSSYRHGDPLLIPLKEGENTLTLKVEEGSILISSISLTTTDKGKQYTPKTVSGEEYIEIEAERITYRNDSSIRPAAEFNVNLTPYSSDKRVLNILDAASFKRAGQKVEYEFEVKKSGYYYVGFNYRQSSKIDFPVFANILVNGEVPYEQMRNYPFSYTTKFRKHSLTDVTANEKMGIYLEEGTQSISIVLSLDPLRNILENIDLTLREIEQLSLEITRITGSKNDKYRDFELEKYVPGVEDRLLMWADRLRALYDEAAYYNPRVNKIGAFSELTIAEQQLRRLAKEPNELPKRMNEFSKGVGSVTQSLANLIQGITDNGISIDKIFIYQNEKSLPREKSVIVRAFENVKRFTLSFTKQDYATNNVNPENLQVWVNRPRQYVEILQNMIDESFTPKTGIKVDLSLMPDPSKLTLANAAGEAPDVATAINYALPFDLAIRDALLDLSQFEDFEEVKQRFPQGLLLPSMIGDSVYSLPETLYFWALFYRKDVMQALNLPVPNTLEEAKQYLPELQRKGMNFFYPTAGMAGMKFFSGTMPVIYQSGGGFYYDTVGKTALNSEKTINGIRELTELFTIYNLPYEVPSFYQQFRDGSLPIGIADYFTYNLLINAAPEIANLWDIALVPGIADENGEIQRWSAGGAESCIIFKSSNKQEEAWEYLKWWLDTETQVQFGNTLQITYGREYIWNSANIEAFKELPWNTNHKKVILEQTQWLIEAPRVPGTYMLERELSNAYNSIVLDGKNMRTAIDLASKRVDRETNRKLEEFGYMKNGVLIKPYYVPKID
jgi:ABC-type glycerol-3-phosphate transport system substrate-binding protein